MLQHTSAFFINYQIANLRPASCKKALDVQCSNLVACLISHQSERDLCLQRAKPTFHTARRLHKVWYFSCTGFHSAWVTSINLCLQCRCTSPCHYQKEPADIVAIYWRGENVWVITKLTVQESERPEMALTLHHSSPWQSNFALKMVMVLLTVTVILTF